jgi:hypothetical protein
MNLFDPLRQLDLFPTLILIIFISLTNSFFNFHGKKMITRCWWLTPVVLATQETEIRRIAIWRQPGQIVLETPSWKYLTQKSAGGVAQGVGPEIKPQHCKKRKETVHKTIKIVNIVGYHVGFQYTYTLNNTQMRVHTSFFCSKRIQNPFF